MSVQVSLSGRNLIADHQRKNLKDLHYSRNIKTTWKRYSPKKKYKKICQATTTKAHNSNAITTVKTPCCDVHVLIFRCNRRIIVFFLICCLFFLKNFIYLRMYEGNCILKLVILEFLYILCIDTCNR